jgi:hypothetical protein
MSLQPQVCYLIPEETACVARAAFPKGNIFVRMRDELGPIYADQAFAAVTQIKKLPSRRGYGLNDPTFILVEGVVQRNGTVVNVLATRIHPLTTEAIPSNSRQDYAQNAC